MPSTMSPAQPKICACPCACATAGHQEPDAKPRSKLVKRSVPAPKPVSRLIAIEDRTKGCQTPGGDGRRLLIVLVWFDRLGARLRPEFGAATVAGDVGEASRQRAYAPLGASGNEQR